MKIRLTDIVRKLAHCSTVIMAGAVLLSTLALAPPALAEESLYTVTVALDPEDPQAQDNAYKDALERVLIRVTGSYEADQLLQLAEIFDNPARYVLRFRARPDNKLEVSFDGDAIVQILRQSRHAVWGADRPLTLVWLAVDWGQGEREIVGGDDAVESPDATRSIDRNRLLRERVEETARHRGIPVVFPLLDTEDLEKVSYGDIWGGFDERLIEASRRYGAGSVLVGRIRADSSQRNRWTYYLGEQQLVWSGQPEEVTNRVADELASLFAIRGDAVLDTYSVTVDGIDSVRAYGRLQQFMENLSVVENFALKTVSGKKVAYTVSVYGGIDRLNNALLLSGMLQAVVMFDPDDRRFDRDHGGGLFTDPSRLEFNYLPVPD